MDTKQWNFRETMAGKFAGKYGITLFAGPDVCNYFAQIVNWVSYVKMDPELYTDEEIKAAGIWNRARKIYNF